MVNGSLSPLGSWGRALGECCRRKRRPGKGGGGGAETAGTGRCTGDVNTIMYGVDSMGNICGAENNWNGTGGPNLVNRTKLYYLMPYQVCPPLQSWRNVCLCVCARACSGRGEDRERRGGGG